MKWSDYFINILLVNVVRLKRVVGRRDGKSWCWVFSYGEMGIDFGLLYSRVIVDMFVYGWLWRNDNFGYIFIYFNLSIMICMYMLIWYIVFWYYVIYLILVINFKISVNIILKMIGFLCLERGFND